VLAGEVRVARDAAARVPACAVCGSAIYFSRAFQAFGSGPPFSSLLAPPLGCTHMASPDSGN
jgi:hypothetical protein